MPIRQEYRAYSKGCTSICRLASLTGKGSVRSCNRREFRKLVAEDRTWEADWIAFCMHVEQIKSDRDIRFFPNYLDYIEFYEGICTTHGADYVWGRNDVINYMFQLDIEPDNAPNDDGIEMEDD